jgi:hypothetical protein
LCCGQATQEYRKRHGKSFSFDRFEWHALGFRA